jgi:hypothetical protein
VGAASSRVRVSTTVWQSQRDCWEGPRHAQLLVPKMEATPRVWRILVRASICAKNRIPLNCLVFFSNGRAGTAISALTIQQCTTASRFDSNRVGTIPPGLGSAWAATSRETGPGARGSFEALRSTSTRRVSSITSSRLWRPPTRRALGNAHRIHHPRTRAMCSAFSPLYKRASSRRSSLCPPGRPCSQTRSSVLGSNL